MCHTGNETPDGSEFFSVKKLVLSTPQVFVGMGKLLIGLFQLFPQQPLLPVTLQFPVQDTDTKGSGSKQDHNAKDHGGRVFRGTGMPKGKRACHTVPCNGQDRVTKTSQRTETKGGSHD